ncbi:DUF4253 domain-containing protein [Streptomyces sp. NPDC059785]|uniref:DUF4253 domain-containing protein n=1 Tax=Streptomyces sp. NPDC059785 TaxID=3346945 RepID=UPI00365200E8
MATLPNALPKLAADPSGGTLGLELPSGTLVDATAEGPWHEPLLWCSDGPAAPGDWLRLSAARRTAGLHPVLISAIDDENDPDGADGASGEGPAGWQLDPGATTYPGDHDPEEVLADYWEEYAADELSAADPDRPGRERVEEVFGPRSPFADTVAPFGPVWPGLAPAGPGSADPDARAAAVADSLTGPDSWLEAPRAALVPARRSADVPAALGWSGPVNQEDDVARLCAVLRSWEDRFGIRVVALTAVQLVLSVAAPPATAEAAEAVAAEHFAFCPDVVVHGDHNTLREYAAREVLGRHVWSFWWD